MKTTKQQLLSTLGQIEAMLNDGARISVNKASNNPSKRCCITDAGITGLRVVFPKSRIKTVFDSKGVARLTKE